MSGYQGKPRFLGKRAQYRTVFLLPTSKIVSPVAIKIWAYSDTLGWYGWLESQRKPGLGRVLPNEWLRTTWKEVSEKQAIAAMKSGKAAPVAPVAQVAPVAPVKPDSKKAGRTDIKRRAGKPGLAKVETVSPEPEPEPTGTDPGKSETTSEASDVAGAVEVAIQALGTVAQSLRKIDAQSRGVARVATAPVATKPGLRKAVMPAPVKRHKAGSKR